MTTVTHLATYPERCDFPGCERQVKTTHGMCEHHKRVQVSGSGSWLEAS